MKASDLIRIAEAELGYIGKKSNKDLDDKTANIVGKYTKYARDLNEAGYYNGNKNGFDWCCVFVDWCFWIASNRSKEDAMLVKPTGTLGAVVKFAYKELLDKKMITISPQAGDQIFFIDSSGELAHTGLVKSVNAEDQTLETIEGNWKNQVLSRKLPINDPLIYAYGRPNYEAEGVTVFNRGEKVKLLSDYTINGTKLNDWVTDGRPLYVVSSDEERTAVTINEDLSGITAVMRTCDVAPYDDPVPAPDPDPDDDSNNDSDWDSMSHLERISVLFEYLSDEFRALADEQKHNI